MPEHTIVIACRKHGTVRTPEGKVLQVPPGWTLLPPGDAALTRRVKAAGPVWIVQVTNRGRISSGGVWAPAERIASIRAALESERSTESYARRRAAGVARRQQKQVEYVDEFRTAVLKFLAFAPDFADLAERLADAVATHATPVGSGTVARTQRISIERRAERAVIAWLRHKTTSYDEMKVARIKGRRREVRKELANRSRLLLNEYRNGAPRDPTACPLQRALATSPGGEGSQDGSDHDSRAEATTNSSPQQR